MGSPWEGMGPWQHTSEHPHIKLLWEGPQDLEKRRREEKKKKKREERGEKSKYEEEEREGGRDGGVWHTWSICCDIDQ